MIKKRVFAVKARVLWMVSRNVAQKGALLSLQAGGVIWMVHISQPANMAGSGVVAATASRHM